VRENEYAKPWREATQTQKRVPVPKKIPDLVAGSNIKKSTAGNKQCESLLDVCRTLFLCNVK